MKRLGLIAEDQSDIDVIRELASKIARKPFTVDKFIGHGCGRIRAKARAWADQLQRHGCTLLAVVVDLDTRDLGALSADLGRALSSCQMQNRVIVIPVREIEAWLLADHDAITEALRLKRPLKKQANPESIPNPKEKLRDLIKERSEGRVTYLNTVHNGKVAQRIKVTNLRRCRSFGSFERFIVDHLG